MYQNATRKGQIEADGNENNTNDCYQEQNNKIKIYTYKSVILPLISKTVSKIISQSGTTKPGRLATGELPLCCDYSRSAP